MENNLSVLGAGFACLDIIRTQDAELAMLGGTAANVVTILSLLGLKTEFLTAKYDGLSGKFIENAFKGRGVKCVFFMDTKTQVPKVIEGITEGKHFFVTVCPKCGKDLIKCNLPSLRQIKKNANQYEKTPNVFFFDRMSEGIKECISQNRHGWNVYEPNSCRMYPSLLHGIGTADIVKYSEDRISAKITDRIIRDINNTNAVLLIVTMGEMGLKYAYRNETGEFSAWNHIPALPVDKVVDSSGSGDWLTAVFLYLFLKKYPNCTTNLSGKYIAQCLAQAQRYAARNCLFAGAQGMLKDQKMIDKINDELKVKISKISAPAIDWNYSCGYCYRELLAVQE